MNTIELKEKIDVILDDEYSKRKNSIYTKRYSRKLESLPKSKIGEPVTINVRYGEIYEIYDEYKVFPQNLPDTKNIELSYPNLELLLKLYERIRHSPELTNYFINYLFNFWKKIYICFLTNETLIKLNKFDRLLKFIPYFDNPSLKHFLMTLDELLFFEYTLFTEKQLNTIKEHVNILFKVKFPKPEDRKSNKQICGKGESILRRINLIFHNALSQSLNEGTDFQINLDRKKVKEKMSVFGFDDVLLQALDRIEEIYWDTSKDKFDNSMAMDKLRTFWERIVELICKKIKEKTNLPYPKTENTKMGNLRKYMKGNLQLDKEHFLMNKLVDILNDKGSHNFISGREYFRLTKNITIEIAFLLLIKLEKFIE